MRGMWLRKSVWKAWLPRGLHPADFLVEAPSRRRRRHGRPRAAGAEDRCPPSRGR